MGRKRPSKSLSKSFGDTKALDKAKSKESFGLQFSDDDDDDEDDDTDRDDLEFVGRGRKRKRPNDEKPRMVKAKKKRRNHPTDDLADEEIAKIIPKGFTVVSQELGMHGKCKTAYCIFFSFDHFWTETMMKLNV